MFDIDSSPPRKHSCEPPSTHEENRDGLNRKLKPLGMGGAQDVEMAKKFHPREAAGGPNQLKRADGILLGRGPDSLNL